MSHPLLINQRRLPLSSVAAPPPLGGRTHLISSQVQNELVAIIISEKQFGSIDQGRRVTPESMHQHVALQSRRYKKSLGLDSDELSSEAVLKILTLGEWEAHPNPKAYCSRVLQTTAIDMCRRRQKEGKRLEIYWEDRKATETLPALKSLEASREKEQTADATVSSPHISKPPLAEVVSKLRKVDWGRSHLEAFCMLDARILLAKQLQALSDDELRHVGSQLNQQRCRIETIEMIFPWGEQTETLELGEPSMAIKTAWGLLTDLIQRSAIYHLANRREREALPKAKLTAALISEALSAEATKLLPNTWTVNCVRAWKMVTEQFPEIATDLKPHSRGRNNG